MNLDSISAVYRVNISYKNLDGFVAQIERLSAVFWNNVPGDYCEYIKFLSAFCF